MTYTGREQIITRKGGLLTLPRLSLFNQPPISRPPHLLPKGHIRHRKLFNRAFFIVDANTECLAYRTSALPSPATNEIYAHIIVSECRCYAVHPMLDHVVYTTSVECWPDGSAGIFFQGCNRYGIPVQGVALMGVPNLPKCRFPSLRSYQTYRCVWYRWRVEPYTNTLVKILNEEDAPGMFWYLLYRKHPCFLKSVTIRTADTVFRWATLSWTEISRKSLKRNLSLTYIQRPLTKSRCSVRHDVDLVAVPRQCSVLYLIYSSRP